MLIDVGGKYMDLDDDRQYIDVICMKISRQFADEIAQRIGFCNSQLEDLEEELDLEAATSYELREALRRIENIAWHAKHKAHDAGATKEIISLFRVIEETAGQYN